MVCSTYSSRIIDVRSFSSSNRSCLVAIHTQRLRSVRLQSVVLPKQELLTHTDLVVGCAWQPFAGDSKEWNGTVCEEGKFGDNSQRLLLQRTSEITVVSKLSDEYRISQVRIRSLCTHVVEFGVSASPVVRT